jgi:hypothetical protein
MCLNSVVCLYGDDNSSTLFHFLRQEKYFVVCGSSEHEFLHKCINKPLTQDHKSYQLHSVSWQPVRPWRRQNDLSYRLNWQTRQAFRGVTRHKPLLLPPSLPQRLKVFLLQIFKIQLKAVFDACFFPHRLSAKSVFSWVSDFVDRCKNDRRRKVSDRSKC